MKSITIWTTNIDSVEKKGTVFFQHISENN